jgi:hypothetical protein
MPPVTTPTAPTGPDAARLTWRAWAAEVRDRQGPHAHVGEDAALLAGSLACLLDLGQGGRLAAANLAEGLRQSAALLVVELIERGVRPPAFPAR